MQWLLDAILVVHIVGGTIGILAFWVPALTRKGGTAHRRAGRIYVKGMCAVVVTGVPLAATAFATGNWLGGVFLGYLVVITGTALYSGLRALTSKTGPAAFITPVHRALAALNLTSGASVLAIGLITSTWLLVGFSLIGILAGIGMVQFIRTPPTDPKYWWYEHLGGMIGTGIAAHVAFLNVGAARLIPGYNLNNWGMLAWFVPVVGGTLAISLLNAYYRKKFARRSPAPGRLEEAQAR